MTMEDSWNVLALNSAEEIGSLEGWMFVNEWTGTDDWTIDSYQGTPLMVYKKDGKVIFLSTRKISNSERFSSMPSLEIVKDSLRVLDLHKSIYLQQLDTSVCNLSSLTHLLLTRCSDLRSLPDSLGNLSNLVEVSSVIVVSHIVNFATLILLVATQS